MSDINTYNAQVRDIQAYNLPILYGFMAWLQQSGLSEQTIYDYVVNIDFFAHYLVYW